MRRFIIGFRRHLAGRHGLALGIAISVVMCAWHGTVCAGGRRDGAQQPIIVAPPPATAEPGLTPKQKQELLKANFERMQHDADELAELAKSLQEDLAKSNQNVLSLKIVEKAGRIEKLAKKIRSAAKAE